MKSIKDSLPDTTALKGKLHTVLGNDMQGFLQATRVSRRAVSKKQKTFLLSVGVILAIGVGIYFLSRIFTSTWIVSILAFLLFVQIIYTLVLTNRIGKALQLLAREVNMAMVPLFTNVLGRIMLYTHDSAHSTKTKDLLDESALMTWNNLEVTSDDIYTIYGDQEVSVRELEVVRVIKNHKGKADTRTNVFKGVFVVADLNKEHAAETYISTDGDRSGFAHRTFWSDLVESGEVKETILEWNEFEDNLHVATSDSVAAREILTPDFMQDVYAWWQEHKLNMRIAFKGKKLYILLPEESIKINTVTISTKQKDIEAHAWSLLRPIWRSLVLAEDVPR